MAAVPLASLARVDDAAPSATSRVAATGDPLGAERIAAFSPSSDRASRSRQPVDDRAVPTTSTSTTSTAPPATTTPPTTAKPKPKVVVVVTTTTAKPKPPPTTTTAAPTTTTTAKPAPAPTNRQEGGASFHDYADASTCAHRSLPFGTVLTVTNLANGKQATCRVNDRGPYVDGRIIDLSRTTFGQLAPVSAGVIQVSIEW